MSWDSRKIQTIGSFCEDRDLDCYLKMHPQEVLLASRHWPPSTCPLPHSPQVAALGLQNPPWVHRTPAFPVCRGSLPAHCPQWTVAPSALSDEMYKRSSSSLVTCSKPKMPYVIHWACNGCLGKPGFPLWSPRLEVLIIRGSTWLPQMWGASKAPKAPQ